MNELDFRKEIKARELAKKMGYSEHIPVERPDIIEYFMQMAIQAKTRSTDNETHHGCVITTKDNRMLSTGYNGLPRS